MQYVFDTSQTKHYRFPTHSNDLIIDRKNAETSEVFIVVLESGEAPPLHSHDDTEQIFYMLEGNGLLTAGDNNDEYEVRVGDVIRIPPSTVHSIKAEGGSRIKYLAVDCFVGGRPEDEPTWDDHVKVICRREGWNYNSVTGNK
ncbi:cupin domain-containing protein [Candidatus Latescibacterota bacterium]